MLPMGFSWAFHLAHMCHMELAQWVLGDVSLVLDRRFVAPHSAEPSLLVYADNADHIGTDADKVTHRREKLSAHLNHIGLRTHEVQEACCVGTSLGVRFDGNIGVI